MLWLIKKVSKKVTREELEKLGIISNKNCIMRNLNKLSLLILVFACPVFVWAQTKRSPEFKEKYTLKRSSCS